MTDRVLVLVRMYGTYSTYHRYDNTRVVVYTTLYLALIYTINTTSSMV